jgi:hypothetical protein
MTNAAQLAQYGSNNVGLSFKNRIINGDMTIDQRNAGASVTVDVSTFGVDRFLFQSSIASKFSIQQNAGSVTPPVGFTNYQGITSLSAYSVPSNGYYMMRQQIEGYNMADLGWGTANAKTVTLSFWVRSSLTGSFGGALQNADQDRSYPFSYTISSANTWEYKTVTIAGDTSGTWLKTNGVGIRVGFGLGIGSTFSGTAGAWAGATYFAPTGATSVVGTSGATFYITGVQLEVGSVATSFDYLPYTTELQLCQRYCFAYSAADAAFANLSSAMTNGTTANFAHVFVSLPVTMRVKPNALTLSAQSDFAVTDFSGSFAWTGMALNASNSTPNLVHLEGSIAGGSSTGRYYEARANGATAARLTLTAEL